MTQAQGTNSNFDYIIIGGGLSGLQLAFELINDPFFTDKEIAIIEPSEKEKNDKTWSYWEIGKGKWDELVFKSWNKGSFNARQDSLELDLGDYSYKMIRSIDFYNEAKKRIEESKNISLIKGTVVSVAKGEKWLCKTDLGEFSAAKVFDSRLANDFKKNNDHPLVLQHFKGWIIKSDEADFDPNHFVMMDYRLPHEKDCCFTYVLPFSKTEALVEFTFFNTKIVEDETYDHLLKSYISRFLKLENYSIKETEKGVIPMTSYPFEQENSENYLKIGTAGGWVKGSSGYSFKNTERKVKEIIDCLKNDQSLATIGQKERFKWYDRIFLGVLSNENKLGNQLFEEMYRKNPAHLIFKFLDEQTTVAQELKIIISFTSAPFLRSLKRILF